MDHRLPKRFKRRDEFAGMAGAGMGQAGRLVCACRACGEVVETPRAQGVTAYCDCEATGVWYGGNGSITGRTAHGEFRYRFAPSVAEDERSAA